MMTDYVEDEFVEDDAEEAPFFDQETSIAHWQLRDLVSAGPREDEIYCVEGQQIKLYSVTRGEGSVVMTLGFKPNSMTCRHGFLVAGGLRSELEVRDLRRASPADPGGAPLFKGDLGALVNNALHVGRLAGGQQRLFVCNNDDTIKVFRLPSMQPSTVIRTQVPMNYAALSPDGRQLACVGDCSSCLLYAATPAGFRLGASFSEASDVGMSTAWSASGRTFASAHQDGTVAVWDTLSGKSIARYEFACATRQVKFSPGAAATDLLAVSEHEDCVHLIDARRWDRVQDLYPGNGAAGISGLAFSHNGRRLWVGMNDGCAMYTVDDLKRRTFEAPGQTR